MPLAAFRPLRHRDYALVFGSGLISNIGSWMQTVAVGAYVTSSTGKAAWAGLASIAVFFPMAVVGPVGGAVADRVDRRRFLMGCNILEAVVATVLAVLVAGGAGPGIVTGVVFLGGCIGAFRLPFSQSMLPDLVTQDDLLAAASLNSAQWNFGRVAGPVVAAAIIVSSGFEWVFTVNALSFFAVVLALVFVRLPHREVPPPERLWRRIADGVRMTRDEPGCRAAVGLMTLNALFAAPFIALIPAQALRLVGNEREGAIARVTGLLTTAQGIGAVVGSLAVVSIAHRYGRRQALLFNLTATPVALIVYAYAPSVPTAFVALTLVGALYIGILAGLNTVVQLRAPAAYRARVLSIYSIALGGIYPIGGLVQGAVADRVGLAPTTAVACLVMLAGLVYLRTRRPHLFAVLDAPLPEAVRTDREPSRYLEGLTSPDEGFHGVDGGQNQAGGRGRRTRTRSGKLHERR